MQRCAAKQKDEVCSVHDFGNINLKGKQGVFKAALFYKGYLPGTSKVGAAERTFLCEGGPGCDPTIGTGRKMTGKWMSDGARDTINSYDLEYMLIDGAKLKQIVTGDPVPDKPTPLPEIAPDAPQKKVRRKL